MDSFIMSGPELTPDPCPCCNHSMLSQSQPTDPTAIVIRTSEFDVSPKVSLIVLLLTSKSKYNKGLGFCDELNLIGDCDPVSVASACDLLNLDVCEQLEQKLSGYLPASLHNLQC